MKHQITISTCGTSIFTNGTDQETVKFLRDNANKKENEYSPDGLAKIDKLIEDKRSKLIDAAPQEVQKLSAELNGFITFYENGAKLNEARENVHYLIHTDTYQGVKAAELIREWGEHHKINMQAVLINDLNTKSVEEFRLGANNLIEWCVGTLPGYRSQGYEIIFNLVGGFKSLQGYMQTLGMFYADETIYIFESGGELLSIPKMPVDFSENAKQSIIKNLKTFRRLQFSDLSLEECSGIPETLLEIIDGKCTLSMWGEMIWKDTQQKIYSEKVMAPLSDKVKLTDKIRKTIEALETDRILKFNKQIDEFSRYVDGGLKDALNNIDFKKLKSDKKAPSTHEFDLWADMRGWRVFCHYDEGDESKDIILDSAGEGIDHH